MASNSNSDMRKRIECDLDQRNSIDNDTRAGILNNVLVDHTYARQTNNIDFVLSSNLCLIEDGQLPGPSNLISDCGTDVSDENCNRKKPRRTDTALDTRNLIGEHNYATQDILDENIVFAAYAECEQPTRATSQKEIMALRRERESQEQRQTRLESNRNRKRNMHLNESEEARQKRLNLDRNRKIKERMKETANERQLRLDHRLLRHRKGKRAVENVFAASNHENSQEHRLSPMNIKCDFCASLHFFEEKMVGRGNLFKDCCHYGKIALPLIPEQEFPETIRDLFMKFDARHVNFFEHIRHLNSSVSFASMNPLRYRYPNNRGPYCFRIYGQIYHKMNLALNPDHGDEPAYGQIFIVDTGQAMSALRHANIGVDFELLRTVYQVIKHVNPFAEAYMMMKDEEDGEIERARRECREPAEIKLLFETGTQMDRRIGYNVPRANEVAAVYVPGADGEVPNAKIVVRERGKELKILNSTDRMVTPMTYPLFYPRGTFGWHPDLKQINSHKRLTRLQYVCYTLAIREKEFNPILYGGKLFQQYCVDEYVKIEGDRMNWIKNNQKKILAEAYKNIDNVLLRRAEETGQPLGRKVILPPSVTNSPRYVEKHFQDAMAVVRRFGKPDLFLTMTCNPQWNEITENMFHEQVASDRPDLIVRVFYLKVKAIMNQITKTKIFGDVIAWMYPVENQGRGLPHIHLLLTLSEHDKLLTGNDVEKRGISARIPEKEKDKQLYDLVKRFMIHGPCGNLNPNCPCMEETQNENGIKIRKCSKGYPKAFQEETIVKENGLALYARPNDGRTVEVFANGKRFALDNRWVVPHNLYLLKMFKCHINLEKVNSVSSVKYLHKYVHKPPDRARLELEAKNDHDEVKAFIDARYICPQEAVWRIFELPMYDRSHSIMSLTVHLQGEQICYFDENMNEEEIREKMRNRSELIAFFELNKTNQLAKSLLYHQIPEKFCLKKGKWNERKAHFNTIGRMVKVSPAEPERYHLRLLLLNVRGACSFDELKTVIDSDSSVKVCTTFSEACLERGLIRNDEEWKRALEEAESFEMPWKLREFFALILVHCNPAKPEELWEMFKDSLSEDFVKNFRKEIAYAKAYREIALCIIKAGKTLAAFPSMEQINVDDDIEQVFNAVEELDLGQRAYASMYDEQKTISDEIMTRIRNPVNEPAFFFLSGPGGTGKTHVNTAIVHLIRGEKMKVTTMAFTGMAATLLPAGRTLHNRFGLSLDMSNSNIGPRSKAWRELRETVLFICDEAPMINKRAMRTLDEKLKEIMNNDIAFGGKVML